jgi:hypothetical protein
LIEKNVNILKDIDNWIDSDLVKPFRTRISFCAGLSSRRRVNGIFHPTHTNLAEGFKNIEKIYHETKEYAVNYRKNLKYLPPDGY